MNSTAGSAGAERALAVICGPTASGKSALALRIAETAGGFILSADSRQVYRGFDIGTAKPTAAEQARVPHAGIDVADPHERFTAADWAAAVPGWLGEAQAQGLRPLVVGGTGFYLRALFAPLFMEPELSLERRRALRSLFDRMPADELRRWCLALDPARAALGRAQWERAIEVALLTGRRISEWHASHPRAPVTTARYLVLDPGAALATAIVDRIDAMLASGWLDEVRALAERVDPAARAWTATGYEDLRQVVTGAVAIERARERVIIATRQYAKRQRTWFRHQLASQDVTRLDPRAPDAFDRAMDWFEGKELA